MRYLGTLHGEGDLLIGKRALNLGHVTYEIDGYTRRSGQSDNGQIHGLPATLAKAFRAGSATIIFADGQLIDVTLADPRGTSAAEVIVSGRFPCFGDGA